MDLSPLSIETDCTLPHHGGKTDKVYDELVCGILTHPGPRFFSEHFGIALLNKTSEDPSLYVIVLVRNSHNHASVPPKRDSGVRITACSSSAPSLLTFWLALGI